MIRPKSIRHTGLPVDDVDKSKAFYRLLGFPEIARPEIPGLPGAWYEIGGQQVHLLGQKNDLASMGFPGLGNHLAVQVESVEEAKRILTEQGIEFFEAKPPPSLGNAPVLFVKDPDGNVVELRTEP